MYIFKLLLCTAKCSMLFILVPFCHCPVPDLASADVALMALAHDFKIIACSDASAELAPKRIRASQPRSVL